MNTVLSSSGQLCGCPETLKKSCKFFCRGLDIRVKKIMKFILGFVAVVFIIMVVFWGSFVYISEYKITKADTSVSPDESYELVLQAVGEADFPFGSALGRLILYEGKSKISKADFELFDDGGCIRSSIWEVTWHEDCVKVILSGDEQLDEQIILYFDGRKEVKQLTDWDKYGEAWDVSESGEIILRPNGVSEYMVLGGLSGMTSLCIIPHSSRSCNCCDSIFGVAFGIMRLRDSKHSGRTPADRVTPLSRRPGIRKCTTLSKQLPVILFLSFNKGRYSEDHTP